MRSINFYLLRPFKKGVSNNDVKYYKSKGKSISKLLNDKPTVINLFLTFPGRKLVRANTMEKVKATQWDFENKMAKASMYGSLELNDRLQHMKAEVMRKYREALTKNPKITLAEIKTLVDDIIADRVPDFNRKPFLDYLQGFIDERIGTVHKLTTAKYKSLVTVIKGWMKYVDVNPRTFHCEQLDLDWNFSFQQYLMTERKITHATIHKYLECTKSFMRAARKRNFHATNAFEEFTIKRPKKDVIWLSEEEIELIMNYQPKDAYMNIPECLS